MISLDDCVCVVCGCLLMRSEAPPHCLDCLVSDEQRDAWELAVRHSDALHAWCMLACIGAAVAEREHRTACVRLEALAGLHPRTTLAQYQEQERRRDAARAAMLGEWA